MTNPETTTPASAEAKPKRTRKQKQRLAQNIVLQLLAMLGIGLLLYPEAANWWNSLGYDEEVSGYVRQIEKTTPEEHQRHLDAAYHNNYQIEPGPISLYKKTH